MEKSRLIHLRSSDSRPTFCGAGGPTITLVGSEKYSDLPLLSINAITENSDYCPNCKEIFEKSFSWD